MTAGDRLLMLIKTGISPAVIDAVAVLEQLTPEQRMEVFGEFCTHCGGDAGCYCMRDD